MLRILIPAYNEAKNLPQVVPMIAQMLGKTSYEIVVVNDGSGDATQQVAETLAEQFPLIVIRHTQNKGVAQAFRTGILHIIKNSHDDDIAVIMEGDGTSSPELLPQMIDRIKAGADIVIASRYQAGGAYERFPLKRLILSRGANLIFRLFFPIPGVRDYSIFYRAYRVSSLKKMVAHYGDNFITVQTFFANIELLLHLKRFVHTIEEVPLVYDYGKKQGKSGMKIGKNLRSYLSFIAHHAFRPLD